MDGMKAYKMSLALDCVCIMIAVIVLYCANKQMFDTWVLVTGALVALGFLIAAIRLLLKARTLFKQEAQEAARQQLQQQEEEEDNQ